METESTSCPFEEIEEADNRYRNLKKYFKVLEICNNRFIPNSTRTDLFQTISDQILDELPENIRVFELIPDKIYSSRTDKVGNIVKQKIWGMKECNEYICNLIKIKNSEQDSKIDLLKKYKEKKIFFSDKYESNKFKELEIYAKIFKACRQSTVNKEPIYKILAESFLEKCPNNVKSFNLINGITASRDIEDGEDWDTDNIKKYMKDLKNERRVR